MNNGPNNPQPSAPPAISHPVGVTSDYVGYEAPPPHYDDVVFSWVADSAANENMTYDPPSYNDNTNTTDPSKKDIEDQSLLRKSSSMVSIDDRQQMEYYRVKVAKYSLFINR